MQTMQKGRQFLKAVFFTFFLSAFFPQAILSAAAPQITGFSPGQGALNTQVTISGTGFTGATAVSIGGVDASSFTVTSPTQIVAFVGAQSRTDVVKVTTPGGTGSTATSSSGSGLGNLKNGKFESLCDPVIDERRSLAINDPSVLGDAARTGNGGHWNFNFLMGQMAPASMTTSTFIKKWLLNWQNTKSVNGFTFSDADNVSISAFLQSWPRVSSGSVEFDGTLPLDLTIPQFTLIAIMFRPDLTGNCSNCAGEGRFVWRAIPITGIPDEVIMEFQLPIGVGTSPTSQSEWNLIMHDLSTVPFGLSYNVKLQAATDLFALKNFTGVAGYVNGSGINQVRTNSSTMEGGAGTSAPWVLREFRLTSSAIAGGNGVVAAGPGELVSYTTRGTPSDTLNVAGSETETWVLANSPAIIAGTASLPTEQWGGRTPTLDGWTFSPKILPGSSLKKAFDMTTCSGCHSPSVNLNSNEGGDTNFVQSSPPGFASFLTGNTTGKIQQSGFAVTADASFVPAPFTFNTSNPAKLPPKANGTYSDLHVRAHNLINKIVAAPGSGGFCQ